MYSANHQWSRRSWAPEDNSSVTDTCIVACQDSSRGPSRASPGSWVLGQASQYVYWVITQRWNQYVWRAPSSRVALSLSRAAFARRFYFQWSRLTSQTFGHCFKFFYWFFVSFTSCISIPLISLTLPTFLPYPTPQKKKKKLMQVSQRIMNPNLRAFELHDVWQMKIHLINTHISTGKSSC